MINERFVAVYGMVGLLVMLILLGLIFFKQVPESYYLPFSIVAAILFIVRIVLRVIVSRQERRAKQASGSPAAPTDSAHP